ncbi:MAG: hypothetical protein HQ557_00730 [Bacteroidetes bacterium]|nr:hypothetical protein [Bacteroidota bacterium]
MKNRILVICVLLVLVLLLPLSAVNMQKIYPIESDVYEALTFLYMEQGKSVPSSSGPWSADELMKMLERVNRASLSPGGRNTYDYVEGKLTEPPKSQPSNSFGSSFGLDIAVEGYMHTNTDDPGFFTDERDWINDFETREPFLNIPFETWAADNFYGYFELPVTINQFSGSNDTSDMFNHSFTTNIFIVPPNQLGDLNMNIPYRAFASAGGEYWNLQFGRDRIGWGSGQTGNLIVGSHLQYNDFLKFTTYHDMYKFTSIAMAFPHPMDYGETSQNNLIEGLRMFISHRLEFRILDIINLAVTEGMMYMSEENTFDLRYLNPLMLYYDYYIRGNSNSILGLDVEINPWKNMSIYGQIAVDEFALPGEPTVGAGTNPEAFGFLGGIKGALPMGAGTAFAGFEAAFTDPYLYLRDNGNRNQDVGEYGINYVVGLREFGGGIFFTEDFLGYEYGNDAIVFNLNGGYTAFDKLRIEGNVFYMLHGTQDMYTLWIEGEDTDPDDPTVVTTPTDAPASGNQDSDANSRDAVEHTLVLGIKGSYNILDNLKVYGQTDWLYKVNPGNLSTNDPVSDLQISLGVAYSL